MERKAVIHSIKELISQNFMASVAVFMLIGMYARFEKYADTVDVIKVNNAVIMERLDGYSKSFNLMDATFNSQLKQASHLMEDLSSLDSRLYYVEMIAGVPHNNKEGKKEEEVRTPSK